MNESRKKDTSAIIVAQPNNVSRLLVDRKIFGEGLLAGFSTDSSRNSSRVLRAGLSAGHLADDRGQNGVNSLLTIIAIMVRWGKMLSNESTNRLIEQHITMRHPQLRPDRAFVSGALRSTLFLLRLKKLNP